MSTGFRSTLILILAASAVAVGAWLGRATFSEPEVSALILGTPRQIPDDLGLIDQTGAPWNVAALGGRPAFLFFGFTHCPDICPATLSILSQFAAAVETPPQVVLVTVDPERDDPQTLAEYLDFFSPDFQGLTGTEAELNRLYRSLGVAVHRPPQQPEDNYTVDHSAGIFILDGDGRYRALYRPPFSASALAAEYPALAKRIKEDS